VLYSQKDYLHPGMTLSTLQECVVIKYY